MRWGDLARTSLLAAWLGAALLFAAVVAPTLFAVLPSRTLAGAVAGRVLPVIFIAGAVVGGVMLVSEFARGPARLLTVLESGMLVVLCGLAQFVVAPRIEAVRTRAGGVLDSLPVGDPIRVEFGQLHGVSVGLLGLAMVMAFLALLASRRGGQTA